MAIHRHQTMKFLYAVFKSKVFSPWLNDGGMIGLSSGSLQPWMIFFLRRHDQWRLRRPEEPDLSATDPLDDYFSGLCPPEFYQLLDAVLVSRTFKRSGRGLPGRRSLI